MTFPAFSCTSVPVTDEMEKAFGVRPIAAYKDRDLLCVFDDPEVIPSMKPAREDLFKLEGLCIGVTAKGKDGYDCIAKVYNDVNL